MRQTIRSIIRKAFKRQRLAFRLRNIILSDTIEGLAKTCSKMSREAPHA